MKKLISFFGILICLCSCNEKENVIYYRYNNQIVTRFNDYPRDYFLLGKHTSFDDTLNTTFIKTSFRGFDGLMDGYLVFKTNGKIEIIRIADRFEKFGNSDSINLVDFRDNVRFIQWEDSIKKDFSNVVRICDVIETEKIINKKYRSKVNIDYGNLKTE